MASPDRLRCGACDHIGLDRLGGPGDPPDPDRYGNRRIFYRCPTCGERPRVVLGRHGGTDYVGLTPVDGRGHPTIPPPEDAE